ncbi:MAG: hypothetical protein R6U19_07660, partial [Bacteroidales bacterium]
QAGISFAPVAVDADLWNNDILCPFGSICCHANHDQSIIESGLKGSHLIFSGFLPQTLKGEAAKNQPPFRDGVKLIFSGCDTFSVFRPDSTYSIYSVRECSYELR